MRAEWRPARQSCCKIGVNFFIRFCIGDVMHDVRRELELTEEVPVVFRDLRASESGRVEMQVSGHFSPLEFRLLHNDILQRS